MKLVSTKLSYCPGTPYYATVNNAKMTLVLVARRPHIHALRRDSPSSPGSSRCGSVSPHRGGIGCLWHVPAFKDARWNVMISLARCSSPASRPRSTQRLDARRPHVDLGLEAGELYGVLGPRRALILDVQALGVHRASLAKQPTSRVCHRKSKKQPVPPPRCEGMRPNRAIGSWRTGHTARRPWRGGELNLTEIFMNM